MRCLAVGLVGVSRARVFSAAMHAKLDKGGTMPAPLDACLASLKIHLLALVTRDSILMYSRRPCGSLCIFNVNKRTGGKGKTGVTQTETRSSGRERN